MIHVTSVFLTDQIVNRNSIRFEQQMNVFCLHLKKVYLFFETIAWCNSSDLKSVYRINWNYDLFEWIDECESLNLISKQKCRYLFCIDLWIECVRLVSYFLAARLKVQILERRSVNYSLKMRYASTRRWPRENWRTRLRESIIIKMGNLYKSWEKINRISRLAVELTSILPRVKCYFDRPLLQSEIIRTNKRNFIDSNLFFQKN